MKIGCLQFAPKRGDVAHNQTRADALLCNLNPQDIDLLVLPELAFSGHNFQALGDIVPFVEPSGSGTTSRWARTKALQFNCIVAAGYPEKVEVRSQWPANVEYYNSTIIVNNNGETIANYRKSFLHRTDECWALEGGGGFYRGIIDQLGKETTLGIGMDIFPYRFEADWAAYEFAHHVLQVKSNLVVVPMSWMTDEDRQSYTSESAEPDMNMLLEWLRRLDPVIRSENHDEIIVVFCNRTESKVK